MPTLWKALRNLIRWFRRLESSIFLKSKILDIGINISRTLRQFNKDQKTDICIANSTLGGHSYLKRSVLWIQIELRSVGGCNFYISHFIAFLWLYDVRFVNNKNVSITFKLINTRFAIFIISSLALVLRLKIVLIVW